jgi:hypothetical protein
MRKRNRKRLNALVGHDITTAFVYGKSSPSRELIWSIQCLNTLDGEMFINPYGARTITEAIDIAYTECSKRQWNGLQPE